MYLCYSDKILASLRITVKFFWFSLLERCCTIAAFTCWWTFEQSWFFFLFWGQGWKLSDCLSANRSPIAFEQAFQLHLNLKEGRNLEGASFKKNSKLSRREKSKCLSSLWSEGRAGTTQLLHTLVTGSGSVSMKITF